MCDCPVVLFQWHVDGEQDELQAIRDELKKALATSEELSNQIPEIAAFTSKAKDGKAMLDDLCNVLCANPDAQVVYFSAHGSNARQFDNRVAAVSFQQFGSRLGKCLGNRDVELVLGACHAMGCGIEAALPQKVRWVWGFAQSPFIEDVVCLMASVVEDAVRLESKMRQANADYVAALNSPSGNKVRAEDYFDPVLNSHLPEIAKWFNHAKRDRGPLWMMERAPGQPGGWSSPRRFA